MSTQVALVTGAHGFVGRHLTEHLRARGDDVVETDRTTGGPDITDEAGLAALLRSVAPEAVYHLAGWSDVAASWVDPAGALLANAEGTRAVLAAAATAGVPRILCVTSADVYGRVSPEQMPLTEEAPLRPVNPYAASKAAAEMLCIQAHLAHDLDVIRVRAFNHIGPGQSERFVAAALGGRIVANERSGSRTVRVGKLDARRDFTDVRDVVAAYRLLIEFGVGGEAYNVCSGRSVSIAELLDGLLTHAELAMDTVYDPSLERPVDTPELYGDSSKLRLATGWTPHRSLETTLGDLMADLRSRPPVTPAEHPVASPAGGGTPER